MFSPQDSGSRLYLSGVVWAAQVSRLQLTTLHQYTRLNKRKSTGKMQKNTMSVLVNRWLWRLRCWNIHTMGGGWREWGTHRIQIFERGHVHLLELDKEEDAGVLQHRAEHEHDAGNHPALDGSEPVSLEIRIQMSSSHSTSNLVLWWNLVSKGSRMDWGLQNPFHCWSCFWVINVWLRIVFPLCLIISPISILIIDLRWVCLNGVVDVDEHEEERHEHRHPPGDHLGRGINILKVRSQCADCFGYFI